MIRSRKAVGASSDGIVQKPSVNSTTSADLEKPLREKAFCYKDHDHELFDGEDCEYLNLYDDVNTAIRKHKARKFVMNIGHKYRCKICMIRFPVLDMDNRICHDCAIEQDFGKTE